MSDDDVSYFRKRAAEERKLALSSAGQHIAEIHLDLARQYEALADKHSTRPKLKLNWNDMADPTQPAADPD